MSLNKKHRFWANVIGSLLMLIFIGLAVNLGRIQIVNHEKYAGLARAQQCERIELPARRGLILDRNGKKLAESLRVGSVYADPTNIKDIARVRDHLSKILKLDPSKLDKRLGRNKKFVWIKRKISDRALKKVKELSLNGVYIKYEYERFYPNGYLASHILGFTDIDQKGIEGIELSCNGILTGEPGYKLVLCDARQGQILMPNVEIQFPKHGDNVTLTIDVNVQQIVEEELEVAYQSWGPKSATAVVMDTATGEILAMANRPTYDPNNIEKYPAKARRNLAITDYYEPGSMMKPIVLSGLFEHGLIMPDNVVDCENGRYKIGKRILHDSHAYDKLTVSEVISHSSNIGMAKLGMRMGVEKMHDYLKKFYFGEKLDIELAGESSGVFHPLKNWSRQYSLVSVSIGHEIGVTPLQFINAFCAIPNGGVLFKPRIIKSITGSDGEIKKDYKGPQIIRRVMRKEVARELMNPILMEVVKNGTGKRAKLEKYQVAGKTGTSQKLNTGKGSYSHRKYIASFIAYAPSQNPRICVLVMVDEPRKGRSYYGGTVAAPVVRNIIKRALPFCGSQESELKMAMHDT